MLPNVSRQLRTKVHVGSSLLQKPMQQLQAPGGVLSSTPMPYGWPIGPAHGIEALPTPKRCLQDLERSLLPRQAGNARQRFEPLPCLTIAALRRPKGCLHTPGGGCGHHKSMPSLLHWQVTPSASRPRQLWRLKPKLCWQGPGCQIQTNALSAAVEDVSAEGSCWRTPLGLPCGAWQGDAALLQSLQDETRAACPRGTMQEPLLPHAHGQCEC